MITKWIRDLVEKYSFITKTELKQGQIRLYYDNDGVESFVRMPLRGGKRMLINRINTIKENIDFKKTQLERANKVREAIKQQEFYFKVI